MKVRCGQRFWQNFDLFANKKHFKLVLQYVVWACKINRNKKLMWKSVKVKIYTTDNIFGHNKCIKLKTEKKVKFKGPLHKSREPTGFRWRVLEGLQTSTLVFRAWLVLRLLVVWGSCPLAVGAPAGASIFLLQGWMHSDHQVVWSEVFSDFFCLVFLFQCFFGVLLFQFFFLLFVVVFCVVLLGFFLSVFHYRCSSWWLITCAVSFFF